MKGNSWTLVVVAALTASAAHGTDLMQVYQRSRVSDPLLQQAISTRLATRETKTQALIALLPVDVSANKGWAGVGDITATSRTTVNLGLQVNLFSWNSWIALKAADATVAQAEANYQAAEQSLVQRVTSQYFAVLAAQDALVTQQSALSSVQIQLDQAERRFEVGLIAVTDVEIARASRDSTAAAVIAAKRALATQQDLLRAITGETYPSLAAPGDDLPLLTPDPASEDTWVTTAMKQNASLIASRLAADIAHDALLTAYGGAIPTVNVGVARNWALNHGAPVSESAPVAGEAASNLPFPLGYNTDTRDLIWGVSVSVPLFTGGLVSSKVRQAKYTWDAAKSGLDYTSRQTEEQTRDAYQGIIAQIAEVRALKEAVKSNQISLQATEAGYGVGTKTAVDVLTQRELLVQAETDYAQAKYSYLNDIVLLRFAAGNLDQHTVEQINGWLTQDEATPPAVPSTPDFPANSATPLVPPTPGLGQPNGVPTQVPTPLPNARPAVPSGATPGPQPGTPPVVPPAGATPATTVP
jgi:outer membrane protein